MTVPLICNKFSILKEEKKKSKDQSNPFKALVGGYDKPEETKEEKRLKEKEKAKPLRNDDWIEKTHLRKLAASNAKKTAFTLFDVYKKVHGMVSYT